MLLRQFDQAARNALQNPYQHARLLRSLRCPTRAVTSTSSSDMSPEAAVEPLTSHLNPHAATHAATSLLKVPSVRTEPQPSSFIRLVQQSRTPPPPPPDSGPLPASVTALLPSLAIQRPHYATIHIHGHPYLVTQGDRVRLPFHMPNVELGDVLRLTRAAVIGSRDFMLTGSPWVDGRLFTCRAIVASVETEPMRIIEKTKRRNRKIKRVRSKHRYTELVIQELKVQTIQEVVENEELGSDRS